MKITKAKYISINNENKAIKATIDEVDWSVPIDEGNRHYQAILEWEKIDGNTIQEAD